jgi:tetratricopeptide (TPR) repeat protein
MCFDYYVGAGDVDAALAVAEYPSPRVIYPDARRTGLLSAALLLVPPDSIHAGLLLGEYGSALYHETGDSDAAQEALGRALIIAKKEHDLALEMRVLTHSAEIDLWTLNWGEVPPKGRRAIELAGSLGDPTFQVTASYFMVRALAGMGQLQEAQQLAEAMIVPAEHSRSFPPLRDAHWSNGTLHRAAGDWQDARRFLDHCVEALSELTRASADLAVLNLQVGNLVQGRENVDRVLANPPAGVT